MMKSGLTNFLSNGLICLSLFITASAQMKKPSAKAIEPTAKEAVKLIIQNGDIPLSANESCRSVGTSKTDKTVLDYLSGILSFQTVPDSSNRIEFVFKRGKGKYNELVWICDLTFFGKDAEDVWSNGIKFKMRNLDRKLLRDSVVCIGTG